MEFSFHAGVHKLHPDSNFDFQMNRQIALGGGRLEDMQAAAPRIKNLEDWKREFLQLARQAEDEGRLVHAASYHRGADFFMSPEDPGKMKAYDKALALFKEISREDVEKGLLLADRISYEDSFLPCFRLPVPNGAERKGAIVIHGGFDSYKEELYPACDWVRKQGWEVFLFEGPGQGEALVKNHLPMTWEWEKPVAAVLDHYGLDGVNLVGLSLGGYLAPRAAAFEPRIKRVAAWDVMYDFFEVLTGARGKAMEAGLKTMLAFKAAPVLNRVVSLKMRVDPFTKWGLTHGMHVMGVKTPYEFFQKARKFSMKPISHKVTQDFLLLAGTRDHFIPLEHYHLQARALTNVRSFTGRIFTEAEHAENHCQCGNIELVLNVIGQWLEDRMAAVRPRPEETAPAVG